MAVGLAILPRPQHSRPRPKAQVHGQRIPRPRNFASRPRIDIFGASHCFYFLLFHLVDYAGGVYFFRVCIVIVF